MSNYDFPKWPKINLPKPTAQWLSLYSSVPCTRRADERYGRKDSFEERLTDDDKLFLQAVGISLALTNK
ncbi:MAG: hypothetical protein C5B47_03740 [Verrucomicrobia bacterium]|nr:MAG: hypothetical protein C5B47_03740 [Verrucomicrobiota bacterium]